VISPLAFRGSVGSLGRGKVRQATVLRGVVRSVIMALRGLGLHGTFRSGPVSLTKVGSGDTRRGEVSYGLAREGPVRLAWVRQVISRLRLAMQGFVGLGPATHGVSSCGVVIQGSPARGAVACANVRLGLSWRGTVGRGLAR
jgi:hypothetical protein